MTSQLAEAFLYVYLGISAFSIDFHLIDPKFIGLVLFATVVARIVSVFLPVLFIWAINGGKIPLKWN